MSKQNKPGLTRRASGLMALEPRFMFDGAAVDTAHDALTDAHDAGTAQLAPADLFKVPANVSDLAPIAQQTQEQIRGYLSTASNSDLFALFNGGKTSPDADWTSRLAMLKDAINQGTLQLNVVAMDSASQFTAVAAYTRKGPNGEPTVFINRYWFNMFDTADAVRALAEELGHAVDDYLNPQSDTLGDEGQSFAAAVVGSAPSDGFASGRETGQVMLGGVGYEVEFASFNFTTAYQIVVDINNSSYISNGKDSRQLNTSSVLAPDQTYEYAIDKESNNHNFVYTANGLGPVKISDGANGFNFSGNDVSAIGLNIGGTDYYGWVSRPIKVGGQVKGFYFWTDVGGTIAGLPAFTDLATAQADGNQDGDASVLDNRGFVLVVDKNYFDNTLGYISRSGVQANTYKVIGSSSDRVDTALNSLLVPNSAPLAANDVLTVGEDSGTTTVTATNGLLSNDTDPNLDALTITGFSVGGVSTSLTSGTGTYVIAGAGTITIRSDGSYDFTPVANYNGSVPPITYTVSDGQGGTTTAVLSITVTPVNDPPVSTDDLITTTVNTPKVLGIQDFGTYSDADNDPFAGIKITALPTDGTLQYWTGSAWASVTLNQTFTNTQILQGVLRFAPDANEKGDVNDVYTTLQFKVYDGTVYSNDPYTLTVKVTGYLAPVANADTNTVTEAGCSVSATPATGNVLTGGTADTSNTGSKTVTAITVTGNTKTVSASTNSSTGTAITGLYGTLTIGSDGSYSYVLNNNLAAIDGMNSGDTKTETFSYTLSDGQGGTATTTLTLTIHGTNDAPVGVNDFNSLEKGTNATSGNFGTVSGNALTNDTDVDNVNGDLRIKLVDGSTPPAGQADVTLNASSPISAVTLSVTQVSGNWTAIVPTSAVTVWTDSACTTSANNRTGGLLTVYRIGNGQSQELVFSDNVALYSYQNTNLYIKDPGNGNIATVKISITSATTSANATISTTADVSNIQAGYTVSGSGVPTGTTVTSIDAANHTVTLSQSVNIANTSLTFHDPNAVTVSATQEYLPGASSGAYGYLIINENGGYTYTLTSNLTADQIINESFTYTVVDPANGCTGTATINIRVYGVDAPTMVNDTLVVNEDSGNHYTFNGVASSTDSVKDNDVNGTSAAGGAGVTLGNITSFKVAGDNTTYTAEAIATADSASNKATIANVGTLRIYPDGTIAFDPVDNYLGPVPTVTYTRSGSDSNSYTANLIISIRAVDDASTLVADTQSVPEDTTATGNVLANDTDIDSVLSVSTFSFTSNGSTVSYSAGATAREIRDGSNHLIGTISIDTNGTYSFVPAANWNGNVPTITYTTNTSSSSTLDITVTPVNDAPVLDLDNGTTGSGYGASYTNAGAAVSISASNAPITDADDTNIERATITLTNPQSGDVLNFDASTLFASYGITATSSSVGGVITVNFSGAASLADYQAAIHAITFSSTGASTAVRVVSVVVNDGIVSDPAANRLDSNTAYTTITVAPDARLVTVMGTVVNEASPNVVFEVSGVQNQWVSLHLGTTGNGTGHASIGMDFLPNLQYLVGGSWTNYTGGLVQIADASGKLLVRTAVLQDREFETTSSTYETLKLTAKNAAGTANVTTDPSNVQADGTAQIRDDGQGSVYLDGNLTFNASTSGTGFPAYLDDDRPVSVNNIAVNEASPKGVFTVSGSVGQIVRFSLIDRTATIENGSSPVAVDGSEDYGPGLQIWDGSAWNTYTAGNDFILASATTFVRTAIVDDDPFEGQHTFLLGVTRQAASVTVYGTGSIYDDGTGDYFAAGNNSGTPNLPAGIVLDDDRTLTINSPLVNEGSDYVVFTLTGNSGQTVSLQLQDDSNNGAVAGKANILESQTLKIWDGLAWVDYNANNLPTFDRNGKIYVRVDIIAEQDAPYEGAETFKLNATLTGTSSAVTGVATIIDDGTGVKFPGTFNNDGTPATNTNALDNDQSGPLTVTGGNYNENSPRAVFTVNANAGQVLTLDVQNAAQSGKAPTGDNEGKPNDSLDTAPMYYSLDGGATWQLYSGPITAGSQPVLVAVDISNEKDDVYEGEEQLKLVVTSPTQSAAGYSSIFDDGTGTVTKEITQQTTNDTGGNDPTVTKDDDRPKPVVVLPPPPAPPTPPAPRAEQTPPPPLAAPVQSFASALTPLAPALVPAEPPRALGDAITSGSGFQIPVSDSARPGLSLYQGITDQVVQSTNVATKVSLPFDAFIHSNKDAVIKLDAKQADDAPLPKWVQFDPASGTFEVTPPPGFKGKLNLKVVARDDDGREATAIFQMFIGEEAPARPQSRESFTEKLRMAGKRPITLVRAGDVSHKLQARDAQAVKVRMG